MKKISSKLARDILATVVYYDCMDFPLTSFEIWKYLFRIDYYEIENQPKKYSLADILYEIGHGALTGYIDQKNGFYFLTGRDELLENRIEKEKISERKIKKLKKIVKFFRFIPFVRMIAITGGLAMKNARSNSDWDLLIVMKSGHIWTGRTLFTIAAQLIGKRRYGKNISDRVCLNYFVTDASLNLLTKDVYSASEYSFIFPIFGWDTFKKFQLKNEWIRNMKPIYDISYLPPIHLIYDTALSKKIKLIGEFIFGGKTLEKFLKKIETKKILKNPKTAKAGSIIHAYDEALIFLPDPKGPKIFEKFKKKIESMTI
jgi:predicted nucleotidyltransferase